MSKRKLNHAKKSRASTAPTPVRNTRPETSAEPTPASAGKAGKGKDDEVITVRFTKEALATINAASAKLEVDREEFIRDAVENWVREWASGGAAAPAAAAAKGTEQGEANGTALRAFGQCGCEMMEELTMTIKRLEGEDECDDWTIARLFRLRALVKGIISCQDMGDWAGLDCSPFQWMRKSFGLEAIQQLVKMLNMQPSEFANLATPFWRLLGAAEHLLLRIQSTREIA